MTTGDREQKATPSRIGPGMLVEAAYEVYDEEGELVGASSPAEPFVFISGYGQVPPGFDGALDGLRAGEARRVRLSAREAFGARDAEAIIEVARDELPKDVAVGDLVEAETEASGEVLALRVLELGDEVAVLDANHPLAGRDVEIDVVIDAVRPATSQELAAAEAALEARQTAGAPDTGLETLIPAARLLKRGDPKNPTGGGGSD